MCSLLHTIEKHKSVSGTRTRAGRHRHVIRQKRFLRPVRRPLHLDGGPRPSCGSPKSRSLATRRVRSGTNYRLPEGGRAARSLRWVLRCAPSSLQRRPRGLECITAPTVWGPAQRRAPSEGRRRCLPSRPPRPGPHPPRQRCSAAGPLWSQGRSGGWGTPGRRCLLLRRRVSLLSFHTSGEKPRLAL